ncbi:hypothetical protein [Phaeobacter sp. HF9A]|uniref:hypothetical protein n=1 Tax=Phaeobacter sp. HF9A TaxID=2721561 RepID=UPI00143050D0|nr:hypothetical protein [Phaeobacter sp. HF9A]NIZ11991.1 hypothetical protein [Phaeobacter sp. HF9A]
MTVNRIGGATPQPGLGLPTGAQAETASNTVDFSSMNDILAFTGIGGKQADRPKIAKGTGEGAPRLDGKAKERKQTVGDFIAKIAKGIAKSISTAFAKLGQSDQPKFHAARGREALPQGAEISFPDKKPMSEGLTACENLRGHLENFKDVGTFLRGNGKAQNAGSDFLRSHARYDVAATDALIAADKPLAALSKSIAGADDFVFLKRENLTSEQKTLVYEAAEQMLEALLPEPGSDTRGFSDVFSAEAKEVTTLGFELIADEDRSGLSADDQKAVAHKYVNSECVLRGLAPEFINIRAGLDKEEDGAALNFAVSIMQSIFSGAKEPGGITQDDVQRPLYTALYEAFTPRVEAFLGEMGMPEGLRYDT